MKKCPFCGYGNPATGVKCSICAADVSAVPVSEEPAPAPKMDLMPQIGLLLLACAALFLLVNNSPWKKALPAENGEDAVTDENSFTYEGTLYGLDKMSALRFLPEADRRRVPPLLSSRDDRVGYAAAKLIGAWARSETSPGLGRFWFEALLQAASTGRPVVRRQAALEAGFAVALGFPASPYFGRLRRAAAGLAAEKEDGLKAAGFFLSSMSGFYDLSGQMLETLLQDPSPGAKLYAACSLSRLGRAEGHAYLLSAALKRGSADRDEALSCLSYSSSPEAGRLLLSVSRDGADSASAAAAKRGLLLREQLAIIKK